MIISSMSKLSQLMRCNYRHFVNRIKHNCLNLNDICLTVNFQLDNIFEIAIFFRMGGKKPACSVFRCNERRKKKKTKNMQISQNTIQND